MKPWRAWCAMDDDGEPYRYLDGLLPPSVVERFGDHVVRVEIREVQKANANRKGK